MSQREIEYLKNLTLKELRGRVKDTKSQLSKDERFTITYSRNLTVSLSNYCQNFCGYCFYNHRIPKLNGKGNIILIGNEQMQEAVQKGISHNCKEVLIMSGENPGSFEEVKDELDKRDCSDFIEFVKDISTYLLNFNLLPHTNIGALTFDELKQGKIL